MEYALTALSETAEKVPTIKNVKSCLAN